MERRADRPQSLGGAARAAVDLVPLPSAFAFPAELTPVERHWAGTEIRLGLGGVLSTLQVRWIDHPARVADAAAKPAQLVTAARCGLPVTDTLVTNAACSVRRFAAAGATVGKALGAPAVVENGWRATAFTRVLDGADLDDLRGVEITADRVSVLGPDLNLNVRRLDLRAPPGSHLRNECSINDDMLHALRATHA